MWALCCQRPPLDGWQAPTHPYSIGIETRPLLQDDGRWALRRGAPRSHRSHPPSLHAFSLPTCALPGLIPKHLRSASADQNSKICLPFLTRDPSHLGTPTCPCNRRLPDTWSLLPLSLCNYSSCLSGELFHVAVKGHAIVITEGRKGNLGAGGGMGRGRQVITDTTTILVITQSRLLEHTVPPLLYLNAALTAAL